RIFSLCNQTVRWRNAMQRGVAALIFLVAGFGLGTMKNKSDARTEILKADEEFSRVTNERGIEAFASFIPEDFKTIRPNSPIIRKKEIVASWSDMMKTDKNTPTWKPLLAVVSAGGDLGYTIGTAEFHKTDDPARPVTSTGKYVTVWKKQRDGLWRVVL